MNRNMHLKLGNRKEFFPAENRFDSLFISEIFSEGKQRNQVLLLSFSRFSTCFPATKPKRRILAMQRDIISERERERERGRERSKLQNIIKKKKKNNKK
jgi:hypothetical protein